MTAAVAFAALAMVAAAATAHGASIDSPDTAASHAPVSASHSTGLFGNTRVGGYLEGIGAWERADGATEELGFSLTRLSLATVTDLRGRVQVVTEVEIEEGGEEVEIEVARVDLGLVPAFNLRAGILLLPLGRFNLSHDGPRTELPARPAFARDLLGTALAQPGLGGFGGAGRGGARFSYEAYAVTGYHEGLLESSPDGVRLPAGATNSEDANASPAWVGRVEWNPLRTASIGVSSYRGAYNRFRIEGLDVAERRDLDVSVIDAEATIAGFTFSGEAARVRIELPPTLGGLLSGRQGGGFVQMSRSFGTGWFMQWPGSRFTAALRADGVDFDRDLTGDSQRSLTLGLNWRPIPESAFKLAFTRGESRDRFNNLGRHATLELAVASYF